MFDSWLSKQTFDDDSSVNDKIKQIFLRCFSQVKQSYQTDLHYVEFMLEEQLKAFERLKNTNEAIIELISRLEHLMENESCIKDVPNIFERHAMIRKRACEIKQRIQEKIAKANQFIGGVGDILQLRK